MSKELTFHYHGPAYELLDGKYYILATDDVGKPVIFDMYRKAVSLKQAGCYMKLYLRKQYHPNGQIRLNAKNFSVKGDAEDIEKIRREIEKCRKK